jgi:phosphonate transport system substrate-binding protein
MKRRTLLTNAALAATGARAQAQPLRLGLAPYLSPAALLATFRPVSEHLQRTLGQPVETYTARDFRALSQAVQAGEYDIALLPAHMARLAITDWRWQPLARSIDATPVVVLVRGAGPVRDATDLRGRTLGTLDPLSLTAAVGARWLVEQGLPDARIVVLPSINSALIALERDELAAVVAAASQLLALPAGTPGGQRTLARVEQIPGPTYVARPGIDAATAARWREALLAIVPDPARPRTASNTRPVPLTLADLDGVEPYAAYLRWQLAAR